MASQPGVRVPWDRLRAWIDEQEAREQQQPPNAPSPLNETQLKAVSQLIPMAHGPDVGDRDYISNLMQYLQARQLELAKFTDMDPVNVPVDGTIQLRWRCVCNLNCVEGDFPREGYGLDPGRDPPMFQSKKSAKQYAAKQALKFLLTNPASAARFYSLPKNAVPSPGPAAEASDTNSSGGTSLNTAPARTEGSADEEPPHKRPRPSSQGAAALFELNSALAGRLGFGSLSYNVEPDPHKPDFYSARPQFSAPGRTPIDLGVVEGVYGKKEAKFQVAEEVLLWLQKEEATRKGLVDSILDQVASRSAT